MRQTTYWSPESGRESFVSRPQIYFGELANDFVLAPTRQREFDFPAGQGDAESYSSYDGTAGVPLDSFWRRLLFAVRFRSLNILLTSQLTPEARILFYRNVRERASGGLNGPRECRGGFRILAGRVDSSLTSARRWAALVSDEPQLQTLRLQDLPGQPATS